MDFFALEYFINPNKRVFWLYILTSVLIAALYIYFFRRYKRVNLSKKLWFHKSAILDYKYFFVNYFFKIFLVFPLVISAKEITYFTYTVLDDNFEHMSFKLSFIEVIALYTITTFVVSDFTRYWLHRLLHTIPFLWRFHKVHHSAKVLNPLTFYRVHPVENLLYGLRYSLSIGVTTAVFIFYFGAYLNIYTVLGVNISIFIFSILGSNLRHSHVPLSFYYFERFFISPKQHQIHHSTKHFNKNYGGYLSIWDRLFNSVEYSKDVKVLKFGLRKNQMSEYESIFGLLFTPFKFKEK